MDTRTGPFSFLHLVLSLLMIGVAVSATDTQEPIRHDAEHHVLLHQYADQWAAEDKEMEQALARLRARNGGKRPNIVYILIDDMGFGEFGMPALNKIRGGRRVGRCHPCPSPPEGVPCRFPREGGVHCVAR